MRNRAREVVEMTTEWADVRDAARRLFPILLGEHNEAWWSAADQFRNACTEYRAVIQKVREATATDDERYVPFGIVVTPEDLPAHHYWHRCYGGLSPEAAEEQGLAPHWVCLCSQCQRDHE